jgi:hypothetical protein
VFAGERAFGDEMLDVFEPHHAEDAPPVDDRERTAGALTRDGRLSSRPSLAATTGASRSASSAAVCLPAPCSIARASTMPTYPLGPTTGKARCALLRRSSRSSAAGGRLHGYHVEQDRVTDGVPRQPYVHDGRRFLGDPR